MQIRGQLPEYGLTNKIFSRTIFNTHKRVINTVGDSMSCCTFFGHRDTDKTIEPLLKAILIDLIENNNVNQFYVGNQGAFDTIVRDTLKHIKEYYPYIHYTVVLAYIPTVKNPPDYVDYSDTIYPDGLESTPLKYAIDKRNAWMLNKSDYVITYVKKIVGGASKFKELAEKRAKPLLILQILINRQYCF